MTFKHHITFDGGFEIFDARSGIPDHMQSEWIVYFIGERS